MIRRARKVALSIAIVVILVLPVAVAFAGPAIALAGPSVAGAQVERIGAVGAVGALMESVAISNTGLEESGTYAVMEDNTGQYVIWPASEPRPAGWLAVSEAGSRAECLAYIESSQASAHVQ
jgi:MbtH protein